MKYWQGPAVWIFNSAKFTAKDFQALIKLGVGGKSDDDTKIGRFGIGFNCAFHLTDLPSFVSGRYISFLDPSAKFLPTQGYPPKKPRGTRIDFIEKDFKKTFPAQCFPYEALGCDFSKEFEGTLFRFPLRTFNLARQSEISNRVFDIKEILHLFDNVMNSKEILFLRNIESYSLYHIMQQSHQPKLIWETQVNNMSDDYREKRKSVTEFKGENSTTSKSDKVQIYQMEIEIMNNIRNRKVSEIWLLCTGEVRTSDKFYKPETKLEAFSEENRLRVT
jgi:hypothetical protein